ncbi:MAG: cation-translocating P-type ATPase [Bacillota bacterium]
MNSTSNIQSAKGLTSEKAEELLKIYGRNELVSSSGLTPLKQLLKILSDPMGLMMLGLSMLYFLTGDTTDAVIILIAYIPVTAVDVFLDLKSEKALKALKSNLHISAKVLRDGIIKDIPVQLIVPGDVIAFEEGQSLPADGQVLECHNLSINESALTGESLPIEKEADTNFFAGTSVLNGRGLGVIKTTGKETQFGKISHLLENTKAEESPLQRKVHSLVKKVVFIAAGLVILLFCIEYFRNFDLIKSLITALTFGMAAVPEEFPLVFTLYLSMGAYRLSKHGVLVKTLPSVESLGNVDVICTDKTGTLTEGRFSLIELVPFGSMSTEGRNLAALLACEPTPVDAMETAIVEKIGGFTELKQTWKLQYDYPFEAQGKHMTHVWSNDQGESVLAMKGAVEGVIEHSDVQDPEKEEILGTVRRLASEGKRILGLASKKGYFSGDRAQDEKGVHFVGLLVFSDPIRQSAKKAIDECQKAGVQIKMLTGDHLLTAHAIADELKIVHTDKSIYSGSQLLEMSPESRVQAYLHGTIFARVTPQQKYEMIKALKDNNKVVAMTGDGVNDSPALKLADIGVSMGENATDVARSTAKMVLLKNDFNGIVQAILEGRNIFANLRRSFSYLIAFHIPVVLLAFIPPIVGWSQLLLPVHIILLELIVHPISAFAFENLKLHSPNLGKSLIPTSTAATAALSGTLLSVLSLMPMFFGNSQSDFAHTRSLALSTVLLGNIGFTLVEAWPNFRSLKVAIIAAILTVLPFILCNTDTFNQTLHLSPMSALEFLQTFILGFAASIPTFLYRTWIGNNWGKVKW